MGSDARRLVGLLVLLAAVLAVPIVPFLGFGKSLEAWMTAWLDASLPPASAAVLVFALLSTDVFLPVPSSVVSTFGGHMLGFLGGTAVSWGGMTVGAALGFFLARAFGRPLASRLSGEATLDRVDALASRFGAAVLVVARAVPLFAEASVLLMGASRLPWNRFLLAVGLSNLGIAAVYSALGDRVPLLAALLASLALPILATALAHWFWPRSPGEEADSISP